MIDYIIGDATDPVDDGTDRGKLILHVCNNKGGWGRGFVLALSKKWPEPEAAYRSRERYPLGEVDFVSVEDGEIVVANMICQNTYGRHCLKRRCVDYGAVRVALAMVRTCFNPSAYTVHAPKFGAGLGGGDWTQIESIINDELEEFDITIYTPPKG